MFPREKLKFEVFKLLEIHSKIVNLITTTLFLYHFKSFTIPLGGPFWLLGRGVRAHPPAYGPVNRGCLDTLTDGDMVIDN